MQPRPSFSAQGSQDGRDHIPVDDGDSQSVALLLQLPSVLLTEALASTYITPHPWVIHAFIEQVIEVAIHGLRAQAADRAPLLGKGITQIVVKRVLVHIAQQKEPLPYTYPW